MLEGMKRAMPATELCRRECILLRDASKGEVKNLRPENERLKIQRADLIEGATCEF